MNQDEKIKALKSANLSYQKRTNDLFQQNEKLESRLFNYQIWVGVLTFVIFLMIYLVWK